MRRWLIVFLFGLCGAGLIALPACSPLTPEQQAAQDQAQEDFKTAQKHVEILAEDLDDLVAEYRTIKKRIDAGESIPATLISRYTVLRDLIREKTQSVKAAMADFNVAKKSLKEAMDLGVPWWQVILGPIIGLATGVAGTYFPYLRPLLMAAQTMATGIGGFSRTNPTEGKRLKESIERLSTKAGPRVATTVDRIAQKVDPHR